jgi:hypothetical protein
LKEKSIDNKKSSITKYNSEIIEIDSIKFRSKLEAKYYYTLNELKAHNEIKFFLMQVPIQLTGNVKYVCDFLVFYNDGTYEFVDVKGFETPMFKLKKKQVEALYPIKITLVKKAPMNKKFNGASASFISLDDIQVCNENKK